MTKKVYAVVGAPLTGKTTYIKKHFGNTSKYYWADMIVSSRKLFGEVLIEDDDKLTEIYNDVNQGCVDNFFLGNKGIVFEYCTGFEETDEMLLELIDQIKALDVDFELIARHASAPSGWIARALCGFEQRSGRVERERRGCR